MDDLLVLCYHGISESWPAGEAVRPADFERQLRELLKRGYRGATLSDALTSSAGKTMVVTFDDAHRSVLELAAPAMEALGVPGTVYVPTAYAGTDRPMGWDGYDVWVGTEHEHELECMGWDELRHLAGVGWEIGSHTKTHPRLSRLDGADIEAEMRESRSECEDQIGAPCSSLAYPYSDYDERSVRAVRTAGYDFAVTVPRGPRAPLPFEWPRTGVFRGESARRLALRVWTRRLGPSLGSRFALGFRRLVR